MRVNIYNEELTDEVEVVRAVPGTGKTFIGLRLLLESSEKLHHDGDDDDRSAITIWGESKEKIFRLLKSAHDALVEDPER